MMQVPLQKLPNQSFTIMLDGNQWDFLFKTAGDSTFVSMTLNGVDILDNSPCPPGAMLIPYQYLENGNFFFVTQNFELPYYTVFGVTQYLIYISAEELAALRVPKSLPITAADFNPIAALPLRFAPQGYTEA